MTSPKSPRLRDVIGEEGIYTIGLFIVSWNQMELWMTLLVLTIFQLSAAEASAVMGGFAIAQKIATLEEAIKRLSELPIYSTCSGVPNRIRRLIEFRNTVAHGQWTIKESGGADERLKLLSIAKIDVNNIKKN